MTGAQQNLGASKWRFLRTIAARKDLNATDLRVCVILADLYNLEKGKAWPSYRYLCNATGAPRSAIARSVKKLDELKIILRISGDRSRSNSYMPVFNLWDGETILPEPQEGWSTQRDSGSPTSGTEVVPPAGPNTRTHPRSTSGGGCGSDTASGGASPLGACAPVGGAPGFEAFWSCYPKKERRQQALMAYGRALAVPGVTPELLAAKAMQYGLAKSHLLDPKWIKNPDNWLRDQCWLEDPQPPRPKPATTHAHNTARRNGGRSGGKNSQRSRPASRRQSPARAKPAHKAPPRGTSNSAPKPREPIGRAILPGTGSVDIMARQYHRNRVTIRTPRYGAETKIDLKKLENVEWLGRATG
jgi:Helix-turn-helix domain